MLGTRYEEYANLNNGLPFVFSADIERDPFNLSTDANWHENLEIQLCTTGSGYILADGEQYDITEGDISVMNSNVIHYTSTAQKLKYDCLIIDSNFCRTSGIDHTCIKFDIHFRSDRLSELFGLLRKYYTDNGDICRTAKLIKTVLDILIELRESHTSELSSDPRGANDFETVRCALKYIRESYAKKLTLDDISKAVLTDKYSLSRKFKAVTGQTVVGYINNYRCQKASVLIREGTTVAEAARLCGFNNMSFFSKTFKRLFSKLPSELKRKAAEK